jgi:glycosyltransferase involved in cell wall biosynthesis
MNKYSPQRVSFLIRSLEAGGAERQLALLAKTLHQQGVKVTVNIFYNKGCFIDELRDAGITVIALDKNHRWDILKFLWRLRKEIKQQSPDVLYSFMSAANLFAGLLKLSLLKTKYIWGIRTSHIDTNRISWLSRLVENIAAKSSILADRIIFNSESGLNYYTRNGYPLQKSRVVFNGIDTQTFCPGTKHKQDGTIIIGMVTRIDPLKNIEFFLKAITPLLQKHKNIQICIIGDGDRLYLKNLKCIAEQLNIAKRIEWIGHRSHVEEMYRSLDIFVSTSVTEGFSNSIAEAMSSELLCIATDVGDSANIIGDAGFLIESRNIEQLADTISSIINLSKQESSSLRQQARKRINENFSIEHMFSATNRVFNELT